MSTDDANPFRPDDEKSSLAALAALTFNWTRTLNDVWAPARFHVEGLHAEVSADIRRAIAEADSVPGNATTQFFGLLNAPAQIDAARELAKAKGGDVPRISRLSAGEFYLATEGRGFQQVRTPMCLSYHPSSPLTEDEVLTRAAGREAGE
jgi:hypothetical protein